MRLDSARALKADLSKSVVAPLAISLAVRAAGTRAQPTTALASTPPTMALGITRIGKKSDYALAVRIQKRGLEGSSQLETIRKKAKGEIDVRYIGQVTKRASLPWFQKINRPLRIGGSIGHYQITGGTLGAFVRSRADGSVLILSNNHVLANENRAKKGDAILQPGAYDGGRDPEDKVGAYLGTVKLKKAGSNLVDAAVATILPEIKFDATTLAGLGKLAGAGAAAPIEGDEVSKLGRTTGKTTGRVSAFELDGVTVQYDMGLLSFDDQLEIEGADSEGFSRGGDSGSLIVNADLRGVGLLFAGSDQGGPNGHGLTFANPLQNVLDGLKVDLFLA